MKNPADCNPGIYLENRIVRYTFFLLTKHEGLTGKY